MYVQDGLIIIYPVSNKIDKISKFIYVGKEKYYFNQIPLLSRIYIILILNSASVCAASYLLVFVVVSDS